MVQMNYIDMQRRFGVGIDTGGTYTDVVIVDLQTLKVLGHAKSPTAHHHLSQSITAALSSCLKATGIQPGRLDLVSMSTTLATNAVVEDKGAEVALIVIGHSRLMSLPVVTVKYIEGGHKLNGEEEARLDLEALVDSIGSVMGVVDAYAVCSAMSIVNPTHELMAVEAIRQIDPTPVFCSHRASSRCGMEERAATAVLNARLMPLLQAFLQEVQTSIAGLGIDANLLIVRGDAVATPLVEARAMAASTVASGPAASAFYGSRFSPVQDALVVDVGGTTTDITIIRDGRPQVNEDGSVIGRWQTHIEAVETYTCGIGGDSFVRLDQGKLKVGPSRVTPLCMASELAQLEDWLKAGSEPKCVVLRGDFSEHLIARHQILRFLAEHGPATPTELADVLHFSPIQTEVWLRELVRSQLILEMAFTPTDALNSLGMLQLGDVNASKQGAGILAQKAGADVSTFCWNVLETTFHKIEDAIVYHVVRREVGLSLTEFLAHRRESSLLMIRPGLNVPIVGLGAAAEHLLPSVAESLGCELYLPEHHAVGNALGALLIGVESRELAPKYPQNQLSGEET
jgi:N-methylhydantoinase A/oxoprolinase/acetone carboxylase beta subunit